MKNSTVEAVVTSWDEILATVEAVVTPWDEILATPDVAQLMKVPVGTVRYWRHIGEGPPAFKLGPKAVRYRRSQVEAWISEQESRSTQGGVA